ncbi:MAG: PAS domain S-box protein, partial [Zoogloea sp.]|nr:PAS domain S-box protein [Zoogloea sp.]
MPDPEELARILFREADSLLQGLFSNALIGVYVIQDDRFAFVNRRLADIFGYPQEELCNGPRPADLIVPTDRAHAQNEMDRRIRGEIEASHYGFRGIRKDGAQIDVEVFGVKTTFRGRPAIIGMLADLSARRQAERSYADQLRFIEQLIETIPSPVFYKDEQGRYIGCNRAFEAYIGMARNALIGKTVFDISPPDLAERYQAADQALFDNPGTQSYETSVENADGTRHDVIFYKASFNKADGELGGLVGVILDISERKRMEEMVWREANYDALTGLPNRRLLRDRLQEESKKAQRA